MRSGSGDLDIDLVLAVRGASLPGVRKTLGISMLPINQTVAHIRQLTPVLTSDEIATLARAAEGFLERRTDADQT